MHFASALFTPKYLMKCIFNMHENRKIVQLDITCGCSVLGMVKIALEKLLECIFGVFSEKCT